MRIPTSTYRIQFHAGFDFEAARQIVPYLKLLGISDLYASPIFQARKGSTHGYDVVDPRQINVELGGVKSLNSCGKPSTSRESAGSKTSCPTTWPTTAKTKC